MSARALARAQRGAHLGAQKCKVAPRGARVHTLAGATGKQVRSDAARAAPATATPAADATARPYAPPVMRLAMASASAAGMAGVRNSTFTIQCFAKRPART